VGFVLVVDDDTSARTLIAESLDMLGYNALTASNGREALEIVKEHGSNFEAIVLDLNMPVMNGFLTIAHLQGQQDTRRIPIIVLTGLSEDTEVKRLPGVVGVISKGAFDVRLLQQVLAQAGVPAPG